MKENKKISLEKLEQKIPFSVPNKYFEDFALEMEHKITENKTIHINKIKSWMYVAAVFVGLIIIGGTYYSHTANNSNVSLSENYETYVLSQVDESSLVDYYLSNEKK